MQYELKRKCNGWTAHGNGSVYDLERGRLQNDAKRIEQFEKSFPGLPSTFENYIDCHFNAMI